MCLTGEEWSERARNTGEPGAGESCWFWGKRQCLRAGHIRQPGADVAVKIVVGHPPGSALTGAEVWRTYSSGGGTGTPREARTRCLVRAGCGAPQYGCRERCTTRVEAASPDCSPIRHVVAASPDIPATAGSAGQRCTPSTRQSCSVSRSNGHRREAPGTRSPTKATQCATSPRSSAAGSVYPSTQCLRTTSRPSVPSSP